MVLGLYLFVDDDFTAPLYAEPDLDEQEEDHAILVREVVMEVVEGDRNRVGQQAGSELLLTWRHHGSLGLTWVALTDSDIRASDAKTYLAELMDRYVSEADDPRNPDREGVEDVVVDVLPPWEE